MINFPKLPIVGYVIYDPETEKFSTGGMGIRWDKKAKIWMGIGPLANHLAQHIRKMSSGKYIKESTYGGLTYKGHEQIFEIGKREFISTVEDKLDSMIERYYKEDAKKALKRAEQRKFDAKKEYEKIVAAHNSLPK